MGKKTNSRSKKAPLASFESLMSIESMVVDENTRNGNWRRGGDRENIDNYVRRGRNDNEVISQPWTRPEFATMTTRQQNCEIFRVGNESKIALWDEK